MILVVYSCLITSSTYAYLYLGSNNNSISGSGKCEGVNYKGENISASNLVSTTNYLEGAKSTITLSKNKDCTIYTYVNLYLYTNNTTTAPITTVKALKYKIVSSNNVTYSGVVSYMEDTLLATLPLEDTEITYTIYLYIDSTLSLGNYNDKTYSGYIYATTEQTSTVGKNEDNTKKNLGLQTIDFDYLGSEQQFIVPQTGTYKIETWGASGGNIRNYNGGKGGYASGQIYLTSAKKLYFYIGGQGLEGKDDGGYNGGGELYKNENNYGSPGGGATDVRLQSGIWSNLQSLMSRIMIAAGGGGANDRNGGDQNYKYGAGNGGAGGGLNGIDGESVDYLTNNGISTYNSHGQGIGAAQINGGSTITYDSDNNVVASVVTGFFGKYFYANNAWAQSGAGGGYYNGGVASHGSAGGGSSFISGHNGCDAIKEESTEYNIIHTGQSKHYSGLYFTNTLMIDGTGYKWTEKKEEYVGMPTHDGLEKMVGNIGNGYAKITVID